jgi:uncharacterized protein YoaH (UPF0181 family)
VEELADEVDQLLDSIVEIQCEQDPLQQLFKLAHGVSSGEACPLQAQKSPLKSGHSGKEGVNAPLVSVESTLNIASAPWQARSNLVGSECSTHCAHGCLDVVLYRAGATIDVGVGIGSAAIDEARVQRASGVGVAIHRAYGLSAPLSGVASALTCHRYVGRSCGAAIKLLARAGVSLACVRN